MTAQSASMTIGQVFTRFAGTVARATGKPASFAACCALVVVWAASGPLFGFSDTWQLVINTGTTIITFLMVFLIQNTQNRDGAALQAKLDELIRVTQEARNEFVGLEHMEDAAIEALRERCEADAAEAGERTRDSHERSSPSLDRLQDSLRHR